MRALAFLLSLVAASAQTITVQFPASRSEKPLDGRLLLLLSNDPSDEPRNQIDDTMKSQMIFGVTVDGWKPGQPIAIGDDAQGYPRASLKDVPAGEYTIQAVLNVYETFHRSDGKTVKLAPDRGEGQHWNLAPGNLLSKPRLVRIGPGAPPIALSLDDAIPPIEPEPDTKYVRHIRIQSKLLSEFWGRPMYLSAVVLVPEGFDAHPQARFPLVIFHDHFVSDLSDFRETPPDPNLKPDYSDRFHLAGYNRIQQEEAYKNYQAWIAPGTPRMLIAKLQHANPYYDDSYAVNSANLGPYGDAIETELIPAIESRFRGIGQGWARFVYGGSTGGWESLAVQIFYPEHYNGAFVACPDPVDFHAFMTVDLYNQDNAFYLQGANKQVEQPAMRDYLGHTLISMRDNVAYEAALGDRGRSGEQFDIWQAVYSPTAEDGYPAAHLRQAHRRDRPSHGRILARALRPGRHPATRLGDAGAEVTGQDPPLRRVGRYLFLERCRLPDGRLPEPDGHSRTRRRLSGRGPLRPARGALLEWRSNQAELVLAASLQPDVRAADHGPHSEDRAPRSRPDKLALLTGLEEPDAQHRACIDAGGHRAALRAVLPHRPHLHAGR